jgi:Dolichyl-phosphate-mannose-protein mannosyltransferase
MRRFELMIGFALAIAAIVFFYQTVLGLNYTKTALLNLDPHPDADEYFAQACALASEGRPFIKIGYDKLPSRYPPGFPALMLPWLKLLPQTARILAPFRTNQSIGALLLLGTFLFYCRRGNPLVGGLTVVLLATLPAFVNLSRSSISDLSGAAAVLLAYALVYVGLTDRRQWLIYLAALVLGLSINIRTQLLFFSPLLLAAVLFPNPSSLRKRLCHGLVASLFFVLGCSPSLILNYRQFGAPWQTGYDFWLPAADRQHPLFGFGNIAANLTMLWQEMTCQREKFSVANLFGTGTYFVAAFVALAAAGLAMMPRNRFLLCAVFGGSSYFIATTIYYFVDGRFYLPTLFLLTAAAARPVGWAMRNAFAGKKAIAASIIMSLFILSCLGYPSQSGYPRKSNHVQAWDALHSPLARRRSLNFEAAKSVLAYEPEKPAIVLSDIDSAYLNALWGDSLVAAPIDQKHHYSDSPGWHYGQAEAGALVRSGLAHSIAIYSLFPSSRDRDQNLDRLPSQPGYEWTRLPQRDTSNAVMMRLTPRPNS